MRLTELLSAQRVGIIHGEAGGRDGEGHVGDARAGAGCGAADFDKGRALKALAHLLAPGVQVDEESLLRVLQERESLQSTGIGDGVAIPHGSLAELDAQCAALLVVPDGVEFDAIDGRKVTLLFAVVGPKRATGEHLKILARLSRLFRNKAFRDELTASSSAQGAFDLIAREDGK